jgi:hypothetical protein
MKFFPLVTFVYFVFRKSFLCNSFRSQDDLFCVYFTVFPTLDVDNPEKLHHGCHALYEQLKFSKHCESFWRLFLRLLGQYGLR